VSLTSCRQCSTILTIAGFDPSGSAGVQVDLKIFH
jgi:hydroxymethylpyrimidine/phosphomethylpyrimidine kinase